LSAGEKRKAEEGVIKYRKIGSTNPKKKQKKHKKTHHQKKKNNTKTPKKPPTPTKKKTNKTKKKEKKPKKKQKKKKKKKYWDYERKKDSGASFQRSRNGGPTSVQNNIGRGEEGYDASRKELIRTPY